MADKIIVRKGLKAQLPILNEAEFGFCTDTKELYIGSSTGNILLNGNVPSIANVTGLAVSGTPTASSISIVWSPVSGATSYDILLNGSYHSNTTGSSTTLTSLTASTQYTITVKSKNATAVASGVSVTASTIAVGTGTITTSGLSFYYHARDGIKTGGVLNNIAPSGTTNNATVVGSSVDAGTSSIPLTPAVTDYIRVPIAGTNMITATSFTFEYIYNVNVLPASNTYAELYNIGSYADHDYSEQVIYLVLFTVAGVESPFTFPTTAINTVKRYHLTIRANDTTKELSLFLDGVLVGTQTYTGSILFGEPIKPTIDFNISVAIPSHNLNFHAVRFYNRALTDGEIATNVANGTAIGL